MTKPKKKKAKILTQDEIWDDSALINSWNEALEEYKLYHSIAARGEKVQEVLKAIAGEGSEADEGQEYDTTANWPTVTGNGTVDQGDSEEGEIDESRDQGTSHEAPVIGPQQPKVSLDAEASSQGPRASDSNHITNTATMPQAVLDSSGQDGNLRNLMMAWYYAGYYTGLHEGQQKAASSAT